MVNAALRKMDPSLLEGWDYEGQNTLCPQTADFMRNLIERQSGREYVDHDPALHRQISEVFLPKPEVCVPNRQAITKAADIIFSVDTVPGIFDVGREAFERVMDSCIRQARTAFNDKPSGCEMLDLGDDHYDCSRCGFGHHLDAVQN